MSEPATRVIGLGNPLEGDDGLGLLALARLADRFAFDPPVAFVDGGTWGLALLPEIEGAERVLFLDAIRAGAAPGTLLALEGDAPPRRLSAKLSPHQIDLCEVLALAALRGSVPRHLLALGLEPAMLEFGAPLSPALAERLDDLVERAREELEAWGHRATPREPTGRAARD